MRAGVTAALVGAALAAGRSAIAAPNPVAVAGPEEAASHVVHRFDFHEPRNYDTIPRNWVRFPDPSFHDPAFPRYTEAYFDPQVGHDAPPSFYLESKGRNIAYRYDGPDTRIRPGEYAIVGWIRPDRMHDSRAALSAYYLDWQGRHVGATQRFSRLVGGGVDESWQRVQVYLPPAPADAHFIGVTCWIVQQDVWRAGLMPHRHIGYRDVDGGAWFDDIAVLGLPRAELVSAHAGNVVRQPDRVRLRATVSDHDVSGLAAHLVVRDRGGREIHAAEVAAHGYDAEHTESITLPPLEAGLYHATLDVSSGGQLLLRRTLTFAVVGRRHRPSVQAARRMGVIFAEAAAGQSAAELALLRVSGAGAAKLPLWTGDPARPGFDAHRDALHELLDQMIESRIEVVGTLEGPPSAMVRAAGAHAPRLLDILSEDAAGWRNHLNGIVAPYASILTSWQVGGDGDVSLIGDERLLPALQAVRRVLREMITAPRLETVATAARSTDAARLPVERLSVELPSDVRPAYVAAHLQPYRDLHYDRLGVSIPLPTTRGTYEEAALADWALKIIEARWAGADVVFVPQPWETRATFSGGVTEPNAAFIVYRTIVDALGDAEPADRMALDLTAQALAFADGPAAVLVLWDPTAPTSGRPHTLQLGAAGEAVDMWGRPVALRPLPDGMRQIVLTPRPVFVFGVERWLMAFRAGLRLDPPEVDFALEPQRHRLTMTNPRQQALSGEVVLSPPDNGEVEPRRMRFALDPGETREFPVVVRYASNEPAGTKTISARVVMLSEPKYALEVPLSFELGLRDLDVWGYAITEGDALVLRHGVTNRADVPLSFQAFADVPGRSRQYRVINELLPGQSLAAEYRIRDAAGLAGRAIRLGLREVNGSRIHNLQVTAP